jgi:hypothetical protein
MRNLSPMLLLVTLLAVAACPGRSETPGAEPTTTERAAASGETCARPDQSPMTGRVARRGADFVLEVAGEAVPVWAISQAEARAPRSPDLSAHLGQEVTLCGRFDGAALYEATLAAP